MSTGSIASLCDACSGADIQSAGAIAHPEITEASGVAASRVHDGVYYVHNDSGDTPRFFAIDDAGNDLGSYIVDAAAAVDWEDIATGPCGDGTADNCIYIGDIGDNAEVRGSYTIYRVREPVSISVGSQNVTAEALPFTYPDGSHNAETLIADQSTGELFIVTKPDAGAPALYRFALPLTPGSTLAKEGDVQIPTGISLVTGGSASDVGVLLRTYTNVILYDIGGDITTRLSNPGCAVSAPSELQGEAVAWKADGVGYVTVAEGANPAVYDVRCMP